MVCRKSAIAAITLLFAVLVQAAPLPESDGLAHEGVASCASSICHGRVEPDVSATVWLNEYRIWLREDKHSGAYKLLLNEQSQSIATKLGIPKAHEAPECLACHTDYVPVAMQGKKFRVEDGVGCEACHGGSENWLKTHTEKAATHEYNIAQGLYPSDVLPERSELCLSCHLGTESKFASHEIMGAGHPRLSFDLQAFGVNQPYHYEIDEDYRNRKATYDDVQTWLSGLATQSRLTLDLMAGPVFQGSALMPELALYECHTCHRPMNGNHWRTDPKYAASLPSGSVRLNDGALQVLIVAMEVIKPSSATAILDGINELHSASLQSKSDVQKQASTLTTVVRGLELELANKIYAPEDIVLLRKHLLRAASEGEFSYYNAAEQSFFGIETLSIARGDSELAEKELDHWYATMVDENRFDSTVFAQVAGTVLGVFQ
jgi:hypothetical protein